MEKKKEQNYPQIIIKYTPYPSVITTNLRFSGESIWGFIAPGPWGLILGGTVMEGGGWWVGGRWLSIGGSWYPGMLATVLEGWASPGGRWCGGYMCDCIELGVDVRVYLLEFSEKIQGKTIDNHMSCHEKTCLQGFRPGLTQIGQKMARSLKFGRKEIVLSQQQKQRHWSAVQLLCSWSTPLFLHDKQKSGFLTSRLKYITNRSCCFHANEHSCLN